MADTAPAHARALAEKVNQDVMELPDRTSPDDWPEAMLVTGEELHRIVADHGKSSLAEAHAAGLLEGLEMAASLIDKCNREGPYNAIGAAPRIRALGPRIAARTAGRSND